MHQDANTILFLARSLGRGGAERQLVLLAKGLAKRDMTVCVTVFYGGGAYEAELEQAGVRIINLDKRGRWDVVPFLYRLGILLRNEHPDVLHSYLGVPNILTALLKFLMPDTRIVWGVRASNMDLFHYDSLSRFSYWLECRLSRFANLIISNSHAGRSYAVAHGFPAKHVVVIPNGIDTQRFRFDPRGRGQIRAEWHIREDELLIGLVARLDPMKDHAIFLQAASLLAAKFPHLRFVCVGNGAPGYSKSLQRMAVVLGLGERLIWAGARDDLPAVYSALDIAASSSSFGEGFSNTIAEAMACSVPCVATAVGDSALIVGDTGSVTPPGDYSALAAAMGRLIDLPLEDRRMLGEACRARVESEFGMDRLVQRTGQALGMA
ncbi:MAG: glycosyltransferase [Pseudomonadota bacterium]